MPTALPRYQVTEVPVLKEALETARVTWPEAKSQTQLIYHLAEYASEKLKEDPETQRALRRAQLELLAQRCPWPHADDPGWLDRQRDAWGC